MLDRIRNNPALVAGFVAALLALLLAFGVPLTKTQMGAILALVNAALAFVVRAQVSPVAPKHRA